jgi:hypothetical protein
LATPSVGFWKASIETGGIISHSSRSAKYSAECFARRIDVASSAPVSSIVDPSTVKGAALGMWELAEDLPEKLACQPGYFQTRFLLAFPQIDESAPEFVFHIEPRRREHGRKKTRRHLRSFRREREGGKLTARRTKNYPAAPRGSETPSAARTRPQMESTPNLPGLLAALPDSRRARMEKRTQF